VTRRGADSGVTLVELLVSVAILGLITPVLMGSLVLGWRTTDATVDRLSDSRNRALVPSLFVRDVQNATTVVTGAGAACEQAGDTLVVRLRWTTTPASGAAVDRVAAWVTTTAGGVTRLERRSCDDSSGSMSAVSSVTTAHGVVGAPAVTCRASGGAVTACGSAVRVELSVTDASGTFTTSARRRAA
jgi:prepilin-type N-terminal cleavage/methylation domain-containing protein